MAYTKNVSNSLWSRCKNNKLSYKKIFEDNELDKNSTIRNFEIVQKEGNRDVSRNIAHYNLQMIIAIISAEMAKLHAETEFEKYRIIQDRVYVSDFDQLIMDTKKLKSEK